MFYSTAPSLCQIAKSNVPGCTALPGASSSCSSAPAAARSVTAKAHRHAGRSSAAAASVGHGAHSLHRRKPAAIAIVAPAPAAASQVQVTAATGCSLAADAELIHGCGARRSRRRAARVAAAAAGHGVTGPGPTAAVALGTAAGSIATASGSSAAAATASGSKTAATACQHTTPAAQDQHPADHRRMTDQGHGDHRDPCTDEELLGAPLEELMARARGVRDQGHTVITFSPKVFIPLTRLCRDSCGYCTFALPPAPGRRAFMTLEEVLEVARRGARQGCTEALFTLGDKPELRWPQAMAELQSMGYASTLEYVHAAAAAVLRETGLLPHVNAGVMGQEELERLKEVSASQGLMLEGTSPVLMAPGGPHHGCPDKDPAARLSTIEAAGRARVPFTTGILIGIGESRADRLHALRAIGRLQEQYGHIQEVIVQNFRAKKGTAMQHAPDAPLSELLWTVAAARIILGPAMNIQAPPNLTPESSSSSNTGQHSADDQQQQLAAGWQALLDAGINDWGGISPITKDFVNPEKPWPHLSALAAATAAAGFLLLPRLPVYPEYVPAAGAGAAGVGSSSSRASSGVSSAGGSGISGGSTSGAGPIRGGSSSSSSGSSGSGSSSSSSSGWLHEGGGAAGVAAAVRRSADSSGYVRGSGWSLGQLEQGLADCS